MKGLWHAFANWATKDLYTYEERALVYEQARRLKMKNDLQEERIARRKARLEKRRLIAMWTVEHRQKSGVEVTHQPVVSIAYLTQNGYGERRWSVQSTCHRTTGAIRNKIDEDFMRTYEEFGTHVRPWLDGSISTQKLGSHKNIQIVVD